VTGKVEELLRISVIRSLGFASDFVLRISSLAFCRMRIYLVNSPLSVPISKDGRVVMPLGITFEVLRFPLAMMMVAGAIGPEHEIGAADCVAQGWSLGKLRKELASFGPDLAVVNCSTPTLACDLEVARLAKEQGALVVLFGQHATALPSHLLRLSSFVDFALGGEPEVPARELVRALSTGASLLGVPGLTFRENGEIRCGPCPPRLPIDELPRPARDLLDPRLYKLPDGEPFTSVLASRGCPYNCPFCLAPSCNGLAWRPRTPMRLVAEVEEVVRSQGIRSFLFRSDHFPLKRRWVEEVCCLMREKSLEVRWICNSRVDSLDEELLRVMAEAGCFFIALGIESGDPDMLERMGKRITPEQIRRTVELCRQLGIKTSGSFVLGFPGETAASLARTAALIRSIPLDFLVLMTATPYPGTALYRDLRAEGKITASFWEEFLFSRYIVGGGLSPDYLRSFMRRELARFYLRPSAALAQTKTLSGACGLARAAAYSVRKLPVILSQYA
jgi:anaerobic magnesium-protoporphyrin IX monomethyl ester cyclase